MSATMSRAQVPRSTSQSMHYPRSPIHEERRASDGYHNNQRSIHLRHPGSPPSRVPSHASAWPVIPPDSPSSPGRMKHPKYRSECFVVTLIGSTLLMIWFLAKPCANYMNGQCPFGDQCDFVHIDGLQRGVVGGGEWSPSSSMPYWEWPREGAESVRGHAPDTRAFPSLALKGSFVL